MSSEITKTNGALSTERFTPRNFNELERFAAIVSKSSFVPQAFRGKAGDCMIAVQLGAELGLAPLQALQNVAVIQGKPSVYGDAVLGLIRGSGLCEYFTESVENGVATARTKRKGEVKEEVRTFSEADAKAAGLWGKAGPWKQYPNRMLQMRARGFLARDVYADVLKGIITAEEAMDYPDEAAPKPVAARVIVDKPATATEKHIQHFNEQSEEEGYCRYISAVDSALVRVGMPLEDLVAIVERSRAAMDKDLEKADSGPHKDKDKEQAPPPVEEEDPKSPSMFEEE